MRGASFNHLIRDREQCRRHIDTERSRGLEVDGKLKFGWLDNRQISRLLTFEYFPDVATGFYIRVGKIRPVAHQSADPDKLADGVVRWQGMTQRQRGKLLQAAREELVGRDQNRLNVLLRHGRKSGLELALRAGVKDLSPHPQRWGSDQQVLYGNLA